MPRSKYCGVCSSHRSRYRRTCRGCGVLVSPGCTWPKVIGETIERPENRNMPVTRRSVGKQSEHHCWREEWELCTPCMIQAVVTSALCMRRYKIPAHVVHQTIWPLSAVSIPQLKLQRAHIVNEIGFMLSSQQLVPQQADHFQRKMEWMRALATSSRQPPLIPSATRGTESTMAPTVGHAFLRRMGRALPTRGPYRRAGHLDGQPYAVGPMETDRTQFPQNSSHTANEPARLHPIEMIGMRGHYTRERLSRSRSI